MKKTFFGKVVSMLSVVAMLVTCVAAVPAYAAESENPAVPVESFQQEHEGVATAIEPRAGNDVFTYGQVVDVLDGVDGHSFTFTTSNLTPEKTVQDDLRMHRLIYRFYMESADNQTTYVRVTLKTQYHGDYILGGWHEVTPAGYEFTNNPNEIPDYDPDLYQVDITHGEKVQFLFETSVSGRRVKVSTFDIYCD